MTVVVRGQLVVTDGYDRRSGHVLEEPCRALLTLDLVEDVVLGHPQLAQQVGEGTLPVRPHLLVDHLVEGVAGRLVRDHDLMIGGGVVQYHPDRDGLGDVTAELLQFRAPDRLTNPVESTEDLDPVMQLILGHHGAVDAESGAAGQPDHQRHDEEREPGDDQRYQQRQGDTGP